MQTIGYTRCLLFLLASLMCGSSVARTSVDPPVTLLPALVQVQDILDLFNAAVERGEVIVFDEALRADFITPRRVEVAFDLEHNRRQFKVYSELKRKLKVPGVQDCYYRHITSLLDDRGKIIETIAHISYE